MRPNITTIRDPDDAEKVMSWIRENLSEARTIESDRDKSIKALNERISDIEDNVDKMLRDKADEIKAMVDLLYAYAEGNKGLLAPNARKTIRLPKGSVMAWRMSPPKVIARDAKRILAFLKRNKLKEFIRVRQEIDKAALRKHPKRASAIPGISIERHEVFAVQPAGLKKPFAERLDDLRRRLPNIPYRNGSAE